MYLGPHVGALRRAGKVEQAILRWERRDRRVPGVAELVEGLTRDGGLKPALDCLPALGVPELCQGALCPWVLWIQRRGAFEATAAESVVADGRGVPPHQRISCGRQQIRIAARLERMEPEDRAVGMREERHERIAPCDVRVLVR